ncbi:hypothetical protein Bbelb_442640 [Branchiostoma belcheri]|nr:hypothetical protein Bbelb_442640 [Branchiostoma belcheri]
MKQYSTPSLTFTDTVGCPGKAQHNKQNTSVFHQAIAIPGFYGSKAEKVSPEDMSSEMDSLVKSERPSTCTAVLRNDWAISPQVLTKSDLGWGLRETAGRRRNSRLNREITCQWSSSTGEYSYSLPHPSCTTWLAGRPLLPLPSLSTIPVTRVQLRNATHLHLPRCRTQTYQASFLPYASRLWNQLPQFVREARSITIFKNMCRAHLLTQQKHQLTRRRGPRYENILAARNRMNCI